MPKELPISATLSEATRLFNELGVSAKGTAPRAGGDNRDPLFHEYMIAKHLESVAKKRVETTLSKLNDGIGVDLPSWTPSDPGMHTIFGTPRYVLTCEVGTASRTVDSKILLAELAKAGVPKDKLDAATAAATKTRNPSRAYRVIANG